MHAWMWGTLHPGFADALAPFACLPAQIAGRNRMIRTLAMDAIRTDPAYDGGDYTAPPRGLDQALAMLFVMSSAPLAMQAQAPTRDAADSTVRAWLTARRAATDANDFLWQFDASRDYDPSALLDRVKVPVLAINSADDEVNPPELGIAERLLAPVPSVRFVLLPVGPTTRGHGTHTAAAVWRDELARFLAALPPLPALR
jgi:homoserine O-acetyltransferase